MSINRTQAPKIHAIELDSLPQIQSSKLENGIDMHVLNVLHEEIIQIELVLAVGKMDEHKKMLLQLVATQVKEGTKSKSSKEIADTFEFYGASIKAYTSSDSFHLQLTCLTKFVDELFPLYLEIFQFPLFPEKELLDFVNRQAQKLLIREKKVGFLADRMFFETIFGRDHYYGYGDRLRYLNSINQNDLIAFHKEYFNSNPLAVFVNGKVSQMNIDQIKNGLKGFPNRPVKANKVVLRSSNQPANKFLEKEGAVQSAIRVGRIGVPDYKSSEYPKFLLTNLIFGGFFGSRLMSNIREDKGYTYGIYSYPGIFKHDSYWMVSTETGNAVSGSALKEIYFEMDRMRNEQVSENELNLVKSYFSGNLLNRLSGSFKLMRAFIELNKHGLDLSYYLQLEDLVKQVSAKEIEDIANKWFDPDEMTVVVAGLKVSHLNEQETFLNK